MLKWSYIEDKKYIRLPAEIPKEGKPKLIPINHHVRDLLKDVQQGLKLVTDDHHEFVFTYRGNPIRDRGGIRHSFKTACKDADIPCGRKTPNGITFHDLRRTVKTNMITAGVSKAYRDLIMGHSLQGMDPHYVAPSDEDLADAMDKYTQWIDDQIASVRHWHAR